MIDEQTIQQVKGVNIVDLIGGFVILKRKGNDHVGKCPFHNEKTPSFSVNKAKNIFKCFGCGVSGSGIDFVIKHERTDFIGAVRIIAQKFNIEINETRTKDFVKPIPRLETVSKKTIEFFEGRGISNNTIIRFGVTEAREWMPQFQSETQAICFNYFQEGELVNIKFRGPKKSFKLAKDAKLIFYNLDSLKDDRTAVIVEGEMDCLSMYEAGVHNCVSVPNGAAKGNQQLQYLDNCWEAFMDKEKIIIAVDNDGPGQILKEELARRLDKSKCYVVEYPEGCKDANDVLVKHGKEYLAEMVENAKPYPLHGVLTVEDMAEEIQDMFENGYPKGKAAGIGGFDEHLKFVGGQLTMVTGIPGSGKDEFVNEITMGLAKHHGWKFGICGFEEPATITVTKLLEKHSRLSFAHRKDPNQRMNEKQYAQAMVFVEDHYKFMNMNELEATVDAVIEKAVEMVRRYGINGLVISPWNCFEHQIPAGSNETLYVSQILGKLITTIAKYDVHCFLIAHPTKIMKDPKTGKYQVVTLYNISGSAHFFNKTHNGISVDRDFATGIVDVYVQKVKWSWLGKIGFCTFKYDTMTRQYIPLSGVPEIHQPQQASLDLPPGNWRPVPPEGGRFFVQSNSNFDEGLDDQPF